jgi:hypothetical protein
MHPPEDDAPGIYQTFAQKILTKQRSYLLLLLFTHISVQLVLVAVVSSFTIWLAGIESAHMHQKLMHQ